MSEPAIGICPVCGAKVNVMHRLIGQGLGGFDLAPYSCNKCGAHLLKNVELNIAWILSFAIAGILANFLPSPFAEIVFGAGIILTVYLWARHALRTATYTLRPEQKR
jgi:hypothetical protein